MRRDLLIVFACEECEVITQRLWSAVIWIGREMTQHDERRLDFDIILSQSAHSTFNILLLSRKEVEVVSRFSFTVK